MRRNYQNESFGGGKAELSYARGNPTIKEHVEPCTRAHPDDPPDSYAGGAPQFEFREAIDVEEVFEWTGTAWRSIWKR